MQPISPAPQSADNTFDVMVNLIKSAFEFLQMHSLMGLSLLSWLLIGCLVGVLMAFLRGKKGGEDK